MLVTRISTSDAPPCLHLAAHPHQSGGSPALLSGPEKPVWEIHCGLKSHSVKGAYYRVRLSMPARDRDLRGKENHGSNRRTTERMQVGSRLRRGVSHV